MVQRFKSKQIMTDLAPTYSLISLIGAEKCSYCLHIREEQSTYQLQHIHCSTKLKEYTNETTMHMSNKTDKKQYKLRTYDRIICCKAEHVFQSKTFLIKSLSIDGTTLVFPFLPPKTNSSKT
jgi:hypothetical protein